MNKYLIKSDSGYLCRAKSGRPFVYWSKFEHANDERIKYNRITLWIELQYMRRVRPDIKVTIEQVKT